MARLKTSRKHYSKPEDKTIKKLNKKKWSKIEISMQLHNLHGSVRTPQGVSQRISVLMAEGEIDSVGRGKRFVTQEALAFAKSAFGIKKKPNKQLELVDQKPAAKKAAKKRKPSRKTSSREVLGFSKTGDHDPNPSYMVKAVIMAKMDGDPLSMFRDLLESGIAEGKTAPDILDDLRLVGT